MPHTDNGQRARSVASPGDGRVQALVERIHANLEAHPRQDAPTVGVEHELFLLKGLCPASIDEANAFFECVAAHAPAGANTIEGRRGVERIELLRADGRYTVIKFEYEPHLIEVASTWHRSLTSLEVDLQDALLRVEDAAKDVGLLASSRPSLDLPLNDERLAPTTDRLRALEHSRVVAMQRRLRRDTTAARFTATMAATQVQVGGLDWWRTPSILTDLHRLEPEFMGLTHVPGFACGEPRSRWKAYRDVFEGMPLLGHALDRSWSMEWWAAGLLASPLVGGPDAPWAGWPASELSAWPFAAWEDFLHAVRDLQAIRPRLFGTVEFRSDPAQPDLGTIMSVAALRFASCLAVHASAFEDDLPSISEAHSSWWSGPPSECVPEKRLTQLARVLGSRGLREERYLRRWLSP